MSEIIIYCALSVLMTSLYYKIKISALSSKISGYSSLLRSIDIESEKMELNEIHRLEQYVGRTVIVVSNEKENLMVAKGIRVDYVSQSKKPFLVVEDILTSKELLVLGKIFVYTKQKFDALNSLDANSRISLLFNVDDSCEVDKTASQKNVILDPEIWKEKITLALAGT